MPVVRVGLAIEAIAVGGLAIGLSASIPGALIDIPVNESGQASGLQSTLRQLGSALGVAILGSLLIGSLGRSTQAGFDEAGTPESASTAVVTAGSGQPVGESRRRRRGAPGEPGAEPDPESAGR